MFLQCTLSPIDANMCGAELNFVIVIVNPKAIGLRYGPFKQISRGMPLLIDADLFAAELHEILQKELYPQKLLAENVTPWQCHHR